MIWTKLDYHEKMLEWGQIIFKLNHQGNLIEESLTSLHPRVIVWFSLSFDKGSCVYLEDRRDELGDLSGWVKHCAQDFVIVQIQKPVSSGSNSRLCVYEKYVIIHIWEGVRRVLHTPSSQSLTMSVCKGPKNVLCRSFWLLQIEAAQFIDEWFVFLPWLL